MQLITLLVYKRKSKMTQHEIDIYNKGISLGWKLAWERIRELLNPIYRNTREKLPNYKLKII